MLYTKDLSKLLITTTVALSCALFTSASFAEEEVPQQPTTSVDPLTGEIIDAPKLLSDMSEEEKAKLSDEEIKALEDLEAALEKNAETAQY